MKPAHGCLRPLFVLSGFMDIVTAIGLIIVVVAFITSFSKGTQKTTPAPVVSISPVAKPTEGMTIALAKTNRLKDGMTYSQVVQIFGKDGVKISNRSIAGDKQAVFKWDDERFGSVEMRFKDDKLIIESVNILVGKY